MFGHSGISRGKILRLRTAREKISRADVDLREGLSSAGAVLENVHHVDSVEPELNMTEEPDKGNNQQSGRGSSVDAARSTDIDVAVVDRLSLEGVERYNLVYCFRINRLVCDMTAPGSKRYSMAALHISDTQVVCAMILARSWSLSIPLECIRLWATAPFRQTQNGSIFSKIALVPAVRSGF